MCVLAYLLFRSHINTKVVLTRSELKSSLSDDVQTAASVCCCSPDTADFSHQCFNLILTLPWENRGDLPVMWCVRPSDKLTLTNCVSAFADSARFSTCASVCVCVCVICHRVDIGAPTSTSSIFYSSPLFPGVLALSVVLAEQEGENLSGLSNNPDKAIFAVRENGTTCLMVEFAVKFLVPYDVLALNGIDVRNPRVL